MKKLFIILVAVMATISVSAQESVAFRFGSIKYNTILKSMPEYLQVEADLENLRQKYEKEMKTSEEEFNAKYEVFLSEQSTYAPSILRKRQSELEDMLRRNEQFRLESMRVLEQARVDMMVPVKSKLNAAISSVAAAYSLAFVLNTDSDAVPFINAGMAYDITPAVTEAVK